MKQKQMRPGVSHRLCTQGRWWRSVGVLIVSATFGTVAFFGYRGGQAILHAPYFSVREITWVGLAHLEEAQMAERFQSVMGRNLFVLDTVSLQRQLLRDPWVKTVVVKKMFPHRVWIRVAERMPAAVEYTADQVVLRSRDGVILDRGGRYAPELPRVVHFHSQLIEGALRLWSDIVARSGMRPHMQMDLADLSDLRLQLEGMKLHFGTDDFSTKWNRFLKIEKTLMPQWPFEVDIDLRFDRQVVVRPAAFQKSL